MMMRRHIAILGAALLLGVGAARVCFAQEEGTRSPAETAPPDHNPSSSADSAPEGNAVSKTSRGTRMGLVGRFIGDQRDISTSPARLRLSDTDWLVPLSGITAGLFVTDRDFSKHLSHSPATISRYKTLSNAGVGALLGSAGGMWLLGHVSHNKHWSETGFLAGEAALNSLVAVEGLKYSLRRERPYQGDGSGSFFQSGGTSFPSEHSAAAWSVASVIAHEYPGPLTKIAAYGLASLVSFSRVKAHQHFPSDVLVGTVIGNLVAQDIYTRHHDPDLGGAAWHSISSIFRNRRDGSSAANLGTPYVPLDSWVYPAFDRLMGLGLVDSGFAGQRPWTRSECARLLGEAESKLQSGRDERSEAGLTVAALQKEFRTELEGSPGANVSKFRLESIYSRVENISGMPLQDGYHFGQTQINDFGRPYSEGWNSVTGLSSYATSGPWVVYVRGELQTAPGTPALPLSVRQVIASADNLPLPPGTPVAPVNQFSLLDSYVGLNLRNWQVSFGKQSLWWGPGEGGPMMFSDNAAPITMFRINRVTPLKLPSIFGFLGPMRAEFFLGQLSGYEFIFSPNGLVGQYGQSLNPQPTIHGERFSFKPTRNFEFGFSVTAVYGGPGYPLTVHTFLNSVFNTGNTRYLGAPNKPGDRRSGLDFSYRLPGLRRWLTFYGDGFTEDEYSPIAYSDRSAWHAGLYLSQFPAIHKLDLRVEGVYTDIPYPTYGPGTFYFNTTYRSGYRNDGNLIASWIGRQGQGAQAWTSYWLTPRNKIQFSYRHQKVSQAFIPGGGTLSDVSVSADFWVRPSVRVVGSVQYENWTFPVLWPVPRNNVMSSVQVSFSPGAWRTGAVKREP
jgi:membrane-associated phospholipid phosphatase